jgi:hypothetical protein
MYLLIALATSYSFGQNDVFEISRSGTLEEISELYNSNNAIINSNNESGYSPLTIACYNNNEAVVKFLIEKVEDPNVMSMFGTPLMAATFKGLDNIVEVLLLAKVDPDNADSNGTTAAHYAVMAKNYKIINLLLDFEADFYIKNNVGQSAFDMALSLDDEKLNNLLKI